MKDTYGYVYILKNESLKEGIYKVGRTKDVNMQIKQLSSTSVPTQFILVDKFYVYNYKEIEALIHKKLEGKRINKQREFFTAKNDEDITLQIAEIIYNYYIDNDLLRYIIDNKKEVNSKNNVLYNTCRKLTNIYHNIYSTYLSMYIGFEFYCYTDAELILSEYNPLEKLLDILTVEYFLTKENVVSKSEKIYFLVDKNEPEDYQMDILEEGKEYILKYGGKKEELMFIVENERLKMIEYFNSQEYIETKEYMDEYRYKQNKTRDIIQALEKGAYIPNYDLNDDGSIYCSYNDDMELLRKISS